MGGWLSLFFGESGAAVHGLGVASGVALNQGDQAKLMGNPLPSPLATAFEQELLPLFAPYSPGVIKWANTHIALDSVAAPAFLDCDCRK